MFLISSSREPFLLSSKLPTAHCPHPTSHPLHSPFPSPTPNSARLRQNLPRRPLSAHLALNAARLAPRRASGRLRLLGLLLALGRDFLLLALADGFLARFGTLRGPLRAALFDHVQRGPDYAALLLDRAAGALFGDFLGGKGVSWGNGTGGGGGWGGGGNKGGVEGTRRVEGFVGTYFGDAFLVLAAVERGPCDSTWVFALQEERFRLAILEPEDFTVAAHVEFALRRVKEDSEKSTSFGGVSTVRWRGGDILEDLWGFIAGKRLITYLAGVDLIPTEGVVVGTHVGGSGDGRCSLM